MTAGLSFLLVAGCGASSEETDDGGVPSRVDGDISGDIEIISFTASESTVSPYQAVELAWDVRGARTIEIGSEDTTLVSTFGSAGRVQTELLAKTTSFKLIARSGDSMASATVEVTVDWPEPQVLAFDVSPRMVTAGSFVSVFWTTANAERVRITRNGTEIANLTTMLESGAISALVTEADNVFRFEAINPDETAFREITVIAEAPPRIVRFSIDPPAVFAGSTTATVTWQTTGATRTDLDIDFTPVPDFPQTASGSFTVTLQSRLQVVHLVATSNLGQMDSYRRIGPPFAEREPNDEVQLAQQLYDSSAALGQIGSTVDVDVYSVFPQGGASLRIWTVGPAGVDCAVDTQISLLSFGRELARNSDDGEPTGRGGACAVIDPERDPGATLLFDGQYFVTVRGERDDVGEYLLIVQEL
jgi:hypothetical protein